MPVHGVVIPADEDEPITKREFSGQLADYQEVVGGLIQPVDVDKLKCTLWANEEGLLEQLPINRRATGLLYEFAPEHQGWTVLVGNVFITGQPDRKGDTQSVPLTIYAVLDLHE